MNSKGQITIFFAVILLIIIGLMAFVINIGIFVKAKINLQNAVDAAAYSGAATQARQLTNIAYMNWEMRNIYKKWMFKYYVLGQLNHPFTVDRNQADSNDNKMDYRLPPLFDQIQNPSSALNAPDYKKKDPWNIPSICIELTRVNPNSMNICNTYTIPGIPNYNYLGSPFTEEVSRTFAVGLTEEKSKNCSMRSQLNFLTAYHWTYGLGSYYIPRNIPLVGADESGAFPRALEAAIRIRNLERILNEPPRSSVSFDEIKRLEHSGRSPIHERTVKAFWAGFRNLAKSPENTTANNLKDTFKLTELTPEPKEFGGTDFNKSLSTYLMREGGSDDSGFNPSKKHYVDLQLQLINYAIFFNLYSAGDARSEVSGVENIGSCSGQKVAIPVPGYPLGFIKNPGVLTYYAVKGESKFTGLMNPFRGDISMVAYSAAKPFGGRIGPRLFDIINEQEVRARDRYSFNYISGLEIPFIDPSDAKAFVSLPVPSTQEFWVGSNGLTVGGLPPGTGKVKFAIPNMPFDFIENDPNGFTASTSEFFQVTKKYHNNNDKTKEEAGLYSAHQFFDFKGSLSQASDAEDALRKIIKPTRYEAANYLIPSAEVYNKELDIFSIGSVPSTEEKDFYEYRIYAPLFGERLLFDSLDDAKEVIGSYFERNRLAIESYLRSLKKLSVDIVGAAKRTQEGATYILAAEIFHKSVLENTESLDFNAFQNLSNTISNTNEPPYDNTCHSIAGKFGHIYFNSAVSDQEECPPYLVDGIRERWSQQNPLFQNFYKSNYVPPAKTEIKNYMTGYLPGRHHGANDDGESQSLLFNINQNSPYEKNHRRNHYSVKFIALGAALRNHNFSYNRNLPLAQDGIDETPNPSEGNFLNYLSDHQEVGEIPY